jgi:regulator of cell morphogenesis and NO signaling
MLALEKQLDPADEVQGAWAEVPLERVIQRLVRDHKAWRIKDFPMIEYLLDCLHESSGASQPSCLASLRKAFYRLRAEMEGHMSREEEVLFPAIMPALVTAGSEGAGSAAPSPSFGSIRNPIAMLEEDHDRDARLLRVVREAANDYRLPETASENLRLLFRELEALEAAMHAHTRLESSVLFARVLAGERGSKS